MSNERPVQTVAPLNFGEPTPAAPIASIAPDNHPTVRATDVRTAAPIALMALTPLVSQEEVDRLGQGANASIKTVSDRMLSLQRAGDTGVLGTQLNQLVMEAKGLDPASLQAKGGLKKLFGKVLGIKENLMGQFDTVKGRIDALVAQMDREVAVQQGRVKDIDDLLHANVDYIQNLQQAVAQGNTLIARLQANVADAKAAAAANPSPQATNLVADLEDRLMVLEKRVDDFGRAILLGEQSGPALILQKSNARQLVDTFRDLKGTTIPAWQNIFSQYLISQDQARGAQLATSVADATDEAIRRGADQLGQSSRQIAEARQRAVVSLETLQYSQQKLFETLDAVKAIEEKGRADRAAAAPQLKALEDALINRFAPGVR